MITQIPTGALHRLKDRLSSSSIRELTFAAAWSWIARERTALG